MNISKESTGELAATLKVEVTADDYSEKVNKSLKDYQRKANLPGFRPGKVPVGMIKKMYGQAVVADEVNKLVSEALTNYLHTNKLNIIGYPMPNDEKTPQVNWQPDTEFTLFFDLGLAPDFELNLSKDIEVDYYKILSDEDTVNSEIEHLRESQGDLEHPEITEENDWLNGDLFQIDERGAELQGGQKAQSYFFLRTISDNGQRQRFVGLRAGDTIDFDIRQVLKSDSAIARSLRITESKAKHVQGMFRLVVSDISRMVAAEMNATFFERVFPGHDDMDEEHFRNHLRERIQSSYTGESDKLFLQEALEKLIEANPFNLPETFLKRLVKGNSRKEVTVEDIEKDYPTMVNGFKWELIRQKISSIFSLEVSDEDVKELVKSYFTQRYGHQLEIDDKKLITVVDGFMKKKEEVEKAKDELFGRRLLQVLTSNLTLNTKEVTLEEFIDMNSNKSIKE
ncbi:MAG: trigger factor [Bacteroidales bacterium]|nr:trigger factor [Bacteroidales bacterium]MDZ4204114.1 trigger factor [Bacteroidales bacterium]